MSKEFVLSGSAEVIVEFLEFAFYSVLYQRSIYPPEDFKSVPVFGIFLIQAANEELSGYVRKLLMQVKKWIVKDAIREVVLVIGDDATGDTLERWQFKICLQASDAEIPKPLAETQREIQALMRQITASVTFLPIFDAKKFFEILVYVKHDKIADSDKAALFGEWDDSSQKLIAAGAERVEFRAFSTAVHKISTAVTFKLNDC